MVNFWQGSEKYLQTHEVPHFTTLQKFSERITGTLLQKIISSFIILTKIGQLFIGIDSSGFKATHASQYYAERAKLRRKYIRLKELQSKFRKLILFSLIFLECFSQA